MLEKERQYIDSISRELDRWEAGVGRYAGLADFLAKCQRD